MINVKFIANSILHHSIDNVSKLHCDMVVNKVIITFNVS